MNDTVRPSGRSPGAGWIVVIRRGEVRCSAEPVTSSNRSAVVNTTSSLGPRRSSCQKVAWLSPSPATDGTCRDHPGRPRHRPTVRCPRASTTGHRSGIGRCRRSSTRRSTTRRSAGNRRCCDKAWWIGLDGGGWAGGSGERRSGGFDRLTLLRGLGQPVGGLLGLGGGREHRALIGP